jgi:methylenetetrahydrofolate dehydrogenase (NADP+)/methenyltetrahydrofolate cyclohydrolase
MIINGRQIAEDVYESLNVRGLTLGLVVVGTDSVTNSFVRIKEKSAERLGVLLKRVVLTDSATTDEVLFALHSLQECDGVIVQLPLPESVDTERVLHSIPPYQDVDGVSARPLVRAPVAETVSEVLKRSKVNIQGKKAVVVGEGRLVGKPTAQMLRERGAEVVVVTRESGDLETLIDADIVVLGAGQVGLVHPEHLKQGVVLIDAGTSEQGGKIAGDALPECASKCAVFTPVPGGVGPVAVAMIFKNLLELSKK